MKAALWIFGITCAVFIVCVIYFATQPLIESAMP